MVDNFFFKSIDSAFKPIGFNSVIIILWNSSRLVLLWGGITLDCIIWALVDTH